MVWRSLRVQGCPAELAEDLTQEALLAGWHRLDRGQPLPPRPWLLVAARNLWVSELRKQGRRPPRVDFEWICEQLAERDAANKDGPFSDRDALRECLDALPQRGREAIDLRYEAGLSREEIGRRLGIGKHGVKSLLQRLRQQLRRCLETKAEELA